MDTANRLLGLLQEDSFTSRQQLCTWLGVSDRCLRSSVEKLRNSGYKIVSSDSETEHGYKKSNCDQDDLKLERLYQSRIKKEYETLIALFGEEKAQDWIMTKVINKTDYTG